MSADSLRAVELSRLSRLHFEATNSRGGTLAFGDSEAGEFSPIELLLVAIAGCTAMDVDAITVKRSEPSRFLVHCSGHYTKDRTAIGLPISTSTSMSSFPTPRAAEPPPASWRPQFASLMIDSAP